MWIQYCFIFVMQFEKFLKFWWVEEEKGGGGGCLYMMKHADINKSHVDIIMLNK